MRALRTFAAALAAVCTIATPALARDVRVALDQAFPIRLAEPADERRVACEFQPSGAAALLGYRIGAETLDLGRLAAFGPLLELVFD